MTTLLQRMHDELVRRNYAATTIRTYVAKRLADRVFTVDSFQGRQLDIVILSLVRNNQNSNPRLGIGFLADRSRANVMFSRAERLLVVIGCSTHFFRFQQEGNWIPNVYEFIAGHRDGVLLDGIP